jgi:hypothetical protein
MKTSEEILNEIVTKRRLVCEATLRNLLALEPGSVTRSQLVIGLINEQGSLDSAVRCRSTWFQGKP